MGFAERIEFENGLLDIMHVTFEQNSEEIPQRYFTSNLTSFEPDGIRINLNFSDPLLVSQGEDADVIVIKLRKSYFLNPNPSLLKFKQNRGLAASLDEDEDYFIVREDIPRQLLNKGDLLVL